jgi:serine/threonine protein kinase
VSADPLSQYEQLTPEEAAQIDAVCLHFEQAWKETSTGGPVPCLASFLDHGDSATRDVLNWELTALDQACRQRYGLADRPRDTSKLSAGADAWSNAATRPRRLSDVAAGALGDWPSIPGLELVSVLGSGGMGVVFKARQAKLDRDVAVKFLRDAHRAVSGKRERFLQEARAVARLQHPNLVQLYEFGEVPAARGPMSQPYLVLEYVPGGSLADLLSGPPHAPREAARLVETVADAIHYAHQQGVIHRDLKPANILLQKKSTTACTDKAREASFPPVSSVSSVADFVPKVTDFGLAKFLAGSDLTRTGEMLGTPNYMAPEQATGKSGAITAAVDVYGLGTILYEALTGRPPFKAATVDATLALVRQDEPVAPRRLQPTVPRDLETICLKCLRKEAGRRYSSAQDLADDLRRFRAGEPVRARPVGVVERFIVWCRRKPGVAALLAALMIVFLAGSAGVLWQWQLARRHAAEAEQNAADYRRERDAAEHRLQMVRDQVHRLNQLGSDLLLRPGLFRTGQAVLEEARAFYKAMLPEDSNDPRMRREAAMLYRLVAKIHYTLGQMDKAAEAFGQQANLLSSLLETELAEKDLRIDLADSLRWRGNALRELGKAREAQKAYKQAAKLHERLLGESPGDAVCQVALANTLLNTATLLSCRDQAEELESLFRRIVRLDRAAVDTAPDDPRFSLELALALEDQGMFFLDTGRGSQAEGAVREALAIHQKMLADGHMKGLMEPYAARAFTSLGRVLAAGGRTRDAEQAYQEAVKLLDAFVRDFPESASRQAALAQTLAGLADLLTDPGRQQEVVEIRRRVISHYETLKARFPGNPKHQRNLALSCLTLVRLLVDLDRQSEADGPYRKALELDTEDAGANNELARFLATSPEPRFREPALAVRLAKKAVSARPKDSDYGHTLGVAHYRNGDHKAAIVELETALSLRAGRANSFDGFFLAMAHGRLGDRGKARTWFDRAVEWMSRHMPHNDELRRFRAEAEGVLAEVGKP